MENIEQLVKDNNTNFEDVINLSNIHILYLKSNPDSDEYKITKNNVEILNNYFPGFKDYIDEQLKTL